MNSFTHIDNKKKVILVLGKVPTQGLESTLTAEKMFYYIYINKKEILLKFALQWSKQLLIVNGKENVKFKSKDSEIVANPLRLGNISNDW